MVRHLGRERGWSVEIVVVVWRRTWLIEKPSRAVESALILDMSLEQIASMIMGARRDTTL
jgi:hypothetical protein